MNDLARLNEAIEYLKKAEIVKDQAQMAQDLGYSRTQTISDITTGKTTLTTKFVKSFSKQYGINDEWILTGQGEMIPEMEIKEGDAKEVIMIGKHTYTRLKPGEYSEAHKGWWGLPMYNTPITASFIETYRDEKVYTPQYYLHDPRFRDCDFGAVITGDSMHSEIRHGDFVALKEIQDTRFIVMGDIYYIVASNGLETCKYVNDDPGNDQNLLLVPRNDKMSPSKLPKDMLLKLYKVRGIIRGY